MTHTKKRILIFSDWFLPGFKAGGPIRSLANLVTVLRHDFFIVTSNKDHHSEKPYPDLAYNTWIRFADNVQVMYLEESHVNRHVFENILTTQSFDKIYFNSLFSPRFTLIPLRAARKAGLIEKCVLAPRGMLKPGALSIKARKKKIFLALAKITGLYSDIIWHATSEDEKTVIQKHFNSAKDIRIAPNLSDVPKEKPIRPNKKNGELKLVCIARISPEKGIMEALKYLKAMTPGGEVTCDFFGTQQNASYLADCQSLAEEIQDVRIRFLGEIVPHSIPDALRSYHFMFMPTLGENFGHSIAEALNHAMPVIISDLTPWRELAAKKAGWDLPLKENDFKNILEYCREMKNAEYIEWCDGAYKHGRQVALDHTGIEASYRIFE